MEKKKRRKRKIRLITDKEMISRKIKKKTINLTQPKKTNIYQKKTL